MSHDAINSWVEQAKHAEASIHSDNIMERRGRFERKGDTIMWIATKIYPWLIKMFEGVRDRNGMLLQPARIRAIAVDVAQRMIKDESANEGHA